MLAFFGVPIDVVQNFPFFANDVHVVESDHSITPSIVLWSLGIFIANIPQGIFIANIPHLPHPEKAFVIVCPAQQNNEKSIASHRNVIYTIE